MKDQGLLCRGVVSTEARLGGGMKLASSGNRCKALVHDGHEEFGERGGHRYAPIVVHVRGVPRALVDGRDLGIAPVLGGQLGNGAIVQEVGQRVPCRHS